MAPPLSAARLQDPANTTREFNTLIQVVIAQLISAEPVRPSRPLHG